MARKRLSSFTAWEDEFAFSRAVRVGDHIFVSGTTGTDPNGVPVDPHNAYLQAKFALEKIHRALTDAGCNIRDVVRLRTYLTDMDLWTEVSKAYLETFAKVRPVLTVVEVSRLFAKDVLVEIEVDAVIEPRDDTIFI